MGMQPFLVAFSVGIGLTSVLPNDEMGPSETQKNFRNLFESIKNNDLEKTGAYRIFLKQEAVRDQQAFDTVKEELSTRQRNALKQNNLVYHSDGEVAMFKRETQPAAFTKEEELNLVKRLDQSVNEIPVAERHISEANQFCITRCLYKTVGKKYPPMKNLNMTSIPAPKKPLYEKLANSIHECVGSCRVSFGYRRFLLKVVEYLYCPDSFTMKVSGRD